MKSKNSYTLQPFTLERKLVEDANRIGQKFPFIHGLLEADVTDVRKQLKELRRNNKAYKCVYKTCNALGYVIVKTHQFDVRKGLHMCKKHAAENGQPILW